MKKYVAAFATSIMIAGVSFMTVSAESYEVKKGDSLWSIADEFNMNAQELADINDLNTTTTIQPNQELVIDNDNAYTVEKGDTLNKISKKNDVSVSDLKEWNQLDSNLIVVGQELKIKEATKSSSSQTKLTDKKQEKSSQPKSAKTKDAVQSKSSEPTESNNKTPEGKTITVSATAYTADCNGCSGVTSTGVDLKANPDEKVIAVDSSVIPLGTKVYVEGYGYATAADTGSAINGNKIDVHVPNQDEAQKWGVRSVDVTIVD